MAATVAACPRFSQNAWKREMCANCFKTRTEHPAPRRPAATPVRHATPKQSILKGSGGRERRAATVCFPPSEAEVIGYDGGDASTDEEDEEQQPPAEDTTDRALFPEPSEEEERALLTLTRRNTDFNSENANLLRNSPPPPLPTPTPAAPKAEILPARKPVVSVTPFGSKPVCAVTPQQDRTPRAPPTARRPPLGHEGPPLTAPALVKEASPPPVPATPEPPISQVPEPEPPPSPPCEKPEVRNQEPEQKVVKKEEEEEVEVVPPAFLRHKDSVELTSPPASPRLAPKPEERPPPVGKVSSTLTVTLQTPASTEAVNTSQGTGQRRRLAEARSSALIRRWTVGERAQLLQPRRPALVEAPEIVPLSLQPAKHNPGLEPRELAGQPDGEAAAAAAELNPPTVEIIPTTIAKGSLKGSPTPEHPVMLRTPDSIKITVEAAKPGEIKAVIKQMACEQDIIKPQQKVENICDKPPTPPSSPLPEEDDSPPPSLPASPPPTLPQQASSRPTSLPLTAVSSPAVAPSSPRTSFLHGALVSRPQVPNKPATLLAGKRASAPVSLVAVPTPQLPPQDESRVNQGTLQRPEKPPTTPFTPALTDSSVSTFYTPVSSDTPITTYFTPSDSPSLKPPHPSKPKQGSYKKRQAPKPPPESKTHTRSLSQGGNEVERRDSITSVDKSPPSKKSSARFSLRRLLRLGSREEPSRSPESTPSPPSSPPVRPEIIHPSALDGREVQMVTRVSPVSPPSTPAGRPRPPPPPPRTLSLASSITPTSTGTRPARPPPPQAPQLLQLREAAAGTSPMDRVDDEHAVYANLDSVKSRAQQQQQSPNKPQRSNSILENSTECNNQLSPASDEGDYEVVQFSDGSRRRRRSAVSNTLEENYGAVVGANHHALAVLVSTLSMLPLPPEMHRETLESFVSEPRDEEARSLVLLQTLQTLVDMQERGAAATSLGHFEVVTPQDASLSTLGPRVEVSSSSSEGRSPLDVGGEACLLLRPADTKLVTVLHSGGLGKAQSLLELRLWGPSDLEAQDKEVALQRWLDLERAAALQTLAQQQQRRRLPVAQELHITFLVRASALALAAAAQL